MPTEKDLVRHLIHQLLELDLENTILHRVLAGIRRANPEIPVLEVLDAARGSLEIRQDVEARYKSLLDAMDLVDLQELLRKMPPSKYLH